MIINEQGGVLVVDNVRTVLFGVGGLPGTQDLSGLLVKSANLSDLTSASTARTNLGLGSLATQSGTFSGTSSGTNTGDQNLSGLLVKASNLSDLTNTATARTNLGLGSLATQSGTFSGTSSGTNTGDQTSVSGNAGTATALATARTINGVSFNGSANITVPAAGSTLTDTVPVSKGGTGLTTVGTTGNVLTSNGTTWVSSAPGLQPVAVDYRGAYNNGDGTYAVGSVVLFNGLLYKKISNPGNPGYPPGGTDWQLFEPLIGSPAYDLWVQTSFDNVRPSNPLLDALGTPSVDFYNRQLFHSGEFATVDWQNCYLNDPDNVLAVNWYSRYMLDSSERQSINWDERWLYGNSSNITVAWEDTILYDLNGDLSVNWNARLLRNTSSLPVVDWENGRLIHTSSLVTVDWITRQLFNSSDTVSLDWESGNLIDINDGPSLSWNSRTLRNTSDYATVDWENATLSSSEVIRVDWSNGVLSDLDGFPMLNWATGEVSDTLHDPTLNWTYRYLYKQWTTIKSGAIAGNVMSNAQYLPTTNTGGTYNMTAPANAGMVIFHQAASGGLIASMTLQLHGATSAHDSVPVGGDMSFTSRYGVTALTVTYGTGNVLLGTSVTTCAPGATITWRKLAVIGTTTYIARLT